jgi:hypothetical protein
MSSPSEDTTISEELRSMWRAKDQQRQAATARKQRVVAGIILGVVALGGVAYFVVAK